MINSLLNRFCKLQHAITGRYGHGRSPPWLNMRTDRHRGQVPAHSGPSYRSASSTGLVSRGFREPGSVERHLQAAPVPRPEAARFNPFHTGCG